MVLTLITLYHAAAQGGGFLAGRTHLMPVAAVWVGAEASSSNQCMHEGTLLLTVAILRNEEQQPLGMRCLTILRAAEQESFS